MSANVVKDLFRRRVPHILGAYFAGGWIVLEFTDWLVNRYLLSPHLTDFTVLAWALMIPTVAMLAYFHGAPGADRWTRFEKIGIPINLVLASVVLLATFAEKDLGAATTSVTVEDEAGATIERTVPKAEFRKSLASYFLDNVSGDTTLDWLQLGIPFALELDLEQDLFLVVTDSDALLRQLRERGSQDGLNVSVALKRDLASDQHLNYFITGTISGTADQVSSTIRLYETRRGRLVAEREYSGADVFEMVDRISLQLRQDLGIPDQHIEETRDLAVSEILTRSPVAFRDYVDGVRAMYVQNDYDAGAEHLRRAVEEDPEFALAYLVLYGAYINLNESEAGQQSLQAGMRLLYKLPERTQLTAKATYYWLVRQDLDRALAAATMHAELYPHDIEAHETVATFYAMKNDDARAVRAMRRVLELDPTRIDMIRAIGMLFRSEGEFDTAAVYFQRYAEQAPTDPEAFITQGDLNLLLGNHEEARQAYERALIVDVGNVSAMSSIASLDRDLGRFQDARDGYDEALALAVAPPQRAQVYENLRAYYLYRGQPTRAVESLHRYWTEIEQYESPFTVLQERLQGLDTYVEARQVAAAIDTLSAIAGRLSPPFDVLLALGQMEVYLSLEDPDSIEAAIPGVERFVDAFGQEEARILSVFAEGQVLELRGDCVEALHSYERALRLQPAVFDLHLHMGRCRRKLGDLEQARVHLGRVLAVRPSDPETHYELARVYLASGETEIALEHLRAALETWSDAEPDYEPARNARDMLAELAGDA